MTLVFMKQEVNTFICFTSDYQWMIIFYFGTVLKVSKILLKILIFRVEQYFSNI